MTKHNEAPVEILNNFNIEKQNDEEIENDILEIQKILYPKKLLLFLIIIQNKMVNILIQEII